MSSTAVILSILVLATAVWLMYRATRHNTDDDDGSDGPE